MTDTVHTTSASGELREVISEAIEKHHPRCDGCGHEIDPDYCGCGDLITHSPWVGHAPIPMGCVCGYDRSDEEMNP